MLRLLLDEHISPAVAIGLLRHNKSLFVHCLVDWENGNFLGRDDAACLTEAAEQGLTLVTYDRRMIPPLLKIWMEEGRAHGGVIFVDEKTISPADIGGLVHALTRVYRTLGHERWTDRVCFLQR